MLKKMNRIYSLLLAVCFAFAACTDTGMPLTHTNDCRFATPEALAQSFALCLRDADYTCAKSYLPGIGNILKSPADTTNTNFGNKADDLLLGALKNEVESIRKEVGSKGGDMSQLQLQEVTQNQNGAVLRLVMHFNAGPLAFSLSPAGLFQNEGSWCFLGTKFTPNFLD